MFNVVSWPETWPDSEVPASFFDEVLERAARAVRTEARSEADVWAMCEYMDCVDAGDLPQNEHMRQRCADAVAAFLWTASPEQIRRFNRGSFAAANQGVTEDFNASRQGYVRAFA